MPNLIIRGVDQRLVSRLKQRAVAHGRSAEAEHREILRRGVAGVPKEMQFGNLRGTISIALDFDKTPAEIIEAMVGDIM